MGASQGASVDMRQGAGMNMRQDLPGWFQPKVQSALTGRKDARLARSWIWYRNEAAEGSDTDKCDWITAPHCLTSQHQQRGTSIAPHLNYPDIKSP